MNRYNFTTQVLKTMNNQMLSIIKQRLDYLEAENSRLNAELRKQAQDALNGMELFNLNTTQIQVNQPNAVEEPAQVVPQDVPAQVIPEVQQVKKKNATHKRVYYTLQFWVDYDKEVKNLTVEHDKSCKCIASTYTHQNRNETMQLFTIDTDTLTIQGVKALQEEFVNVSESEESSSSSDDEPPKKTIGKKK